MDNELVYFIAYHRMVELGGTLRSFIPTPLF